MNNTVETWLDEDTALKAAGLKGLGGSSPSSTAKNARLAKLADAIDLGSIVQRRGGSSPSSGTNKMHLSSSG